MTGLLQTPIAHLHLSNEETQQHGPVQQPRSCRRRGGGCRKFVIQNVRFVVCEIIVGQEIDCLCSLTENSTYKYASFVIGKGYVEECGQTSMNDDSFVGCHFLSLRATAHESVGATDHVSRSSSTLLFVRQQCCFFCSLATPFFDVLDIAVLSAIPFRQTNFCDISYAWDWLIVDYISATWSNRTGHVQAPGVTNDAAQQYCWTRRDNLQLAMVYNPFCVYVYGFPEQTHQRMQTPSLDIQRISSPSSSVASKLKVNTSPAAMCEKGILIWTCGCTHLQDPRPCHKARFRNKACDGYAFTWVYRTPIPLHTSLRCPSCIRADEATALRRANEALLARSSAYPTLKSVATGDDSHRVRAGRPTFSRTASGTQIHRVPDNWSSEMNRLPGNANEYSAFLAGRFDPLVRLPDTHVPQPQTSRAASPTKPTELEIGARDMPVPMQRSRSHAPPQCWPGPVVLGEDDYPYVEFRGALSATPGASRRPSYTGRVLDKGWEPPSSSTLPPQSDVDTAPPSQVPSPQLKVSPPQLRITSSE